MKKILIALCIAMSLPAFAQNTTTSGATQATQQAQNAAATANNAGLNGSNNFTIEAASIPTATRADVYQHIDSSGTTTLKNTPSVSGPQLTTSNDTCMGSTSGSANVAGIGVGFGTTWTDEHCKRLKASRELWNKGYRAASLAVDCMDPNMKVALELTMTKCPQSMTDEERVTAFTPPVAAQVVRPVSTAPVAVAPVALVQPTTVPFVTATASTVTTRDAKGDLFVDMRTPR